MKIMSVNTGSSSLKFALYDFTNKHILASGNFERIGIEGSSYKIKYGENKFGATAHLETHADAVAILMDQMLSLGMIKSLDEISAIGHRIVQGVDRFNQSVLLTDEVMEELENLQGFAPLHNPPAISGIHAFREVFPDIPMIGVFDTAFHQTMEADAYLYPVPMSWYKDYSVRKYGFHGINHQYVTRVIRYFRKTDDFTLISCHIGNGGSVCAIKNMRCIDTSMGFTPLAGLMMGSRSGDIDPSIIPYIMEMENKSAEEVIEELNQNSGLLGISEQSSDMRDILELCEHGDPQAQLVRKMFVRRVVNYIAQYYVLLGGADVIAFTGGIGENSVEIREEICEQLECLGVHLDPRRNDSHGELCKISTKRSPVAAYVIPANEELMIAFETLRIIDPESIPTEEEDEYNKYISSRTRSIVPKDTFAVMTFGPLQKDKPEEKKS